MISKQRLKSLGGKMLVKINSRGRGGSAGAINYLLGDFGTVNGRMPKKAEQERGIGKRSVKPVILRGDVKQTAQLIDSLSFSRNYTSGTLSFTENNIPDHQKNKLMDEYTKMLLAGLDADQYDVLWIEHRDKDRLELNFLIPNVELGTGKRLQPYYDSVDRDRVNAWQQTINDQYGFTDPHSPEHKRFSVTAHDLPQNKQQAVSEIKLALVCQAEDGLIRDRDDVINELKSLGFEIAREATSFISIKDPRGGKNIRLKGEIYERNFKFSEETEETIGRTIREYQENRKQRLAAATDTLNKTYKAKCKYNNERYPRAKQAEPSSNAASNIESLANIHNGNGIRSKLNCGGTVHTTEIKHKSILKVVGKNVRNKSTISTCLEAVVTAVRTAVRRSLTASKHTVRANNFTQQLRAKQQPIFVARWKDSSRTQGRNNKQKRGLNMR